MRERAELAQCHGSEQDRGAVPPGGMIDDPPDVWRCPSRDATLDDVARPFHRSLLHWIAMPGFHRSLPTALVLTVVLTAAAGSQPAQPPQATQPAQPAQGAALAAHADSVFARFTPEVPGCAVGVYQNARTIFAKGYGSANIEYGIPITPATPFVAGSVSKQFTAAAIALLASEKRLSLGDDVRKYVPELPDYGTPITIGHLVHHTSGLRDWWELVGVAGLRYDDTYTRQDVLDMTTRQQGLNFTPGDRYLYSNTGYIVLGLVVERVTGKSLREFAAERFFGPLQMTSSHFQDDHRVPVRGRAYAYSPAPGGGFRINVWNNDLVGQGGLMTTVLDLAKWDENFYTGTVGGPAFLATQLQQGKLNSDSTLSYAFGLEIGRYRGLDVVEHTGSTGGYRSVIIRFPKQHTSVAVLCNVSNAAPATLARRVADHVLRDALAPAPVTASGPAAASGPASPARSSASGAARPAPLSRAELASLAGRYYSAELDATYEIVVLDSTILLHRPRGRSDTLTVRDSVTLTGPVGTLRFTRTGTRPAASFILNAGRVENLKFVRR